MSMDGQQQQQFNLHEEVTVTFSHRQALTAVLTLAALAVSVFLFVHRNAPAGHRGHGDVSTGLLREERLSGAQQPRETKTLRAAVFKPFKLIEVETLNYNTRLFRFAIPPLNGAPAGLGLPIGRHVSVRAVIDGQKVVRPYTPTSPPEQVGSFDLVLKRYQMGKISKFMFDELKVGDSMEVRGPTGRFKYSANRYARIGCVAAGSGITPMLQLIRGIVSDSADDTELSLVFQNRGQEDILLRDELDALVAANDGRLSVTYVLSKPHDGWDETEEHVAGHITPELLRERLPAPGAGTLVCLCGPGGFNEAMQGHFAELGHEGDGVYEF